MERRLNGKLDSYIINFKTEIAKRLQVIVDGLDNVKTDSNNANANVDDARLKCNDLAGFVYNYEKMRLNKEDFMKRKRVKSIVPIYDRCCAKRASGEQCTRRKKEGEVYCGTHIKGTPHSVMEEPSSEAPTTKNVKVDIWAQDIKGIIYYIDKNGNVYDTEDIMKIDKHPKRVIAKYVQDGAGNYSIPSMFSSSTVASVNSTASTATESM
jgi:hypothetical protein